MNRGFIGSLALVAVILLSPAVFAQKKAPPKGGKPGKGKGEAEIPFVFTPAMAQRLRGNDPAQVRSALDEIRLTGKPAAAAAPVIVEVLQRGTADDLAEAAVDTLGDMESDAAVPTLTMYAAHRNVKVRRAAIRALTHSKGAPTVAALRRALSDADPSVRSFAASGLGSLKAKEAVPDLGRALDHNVNEAAAAIGQVCTGKECEELGDRLGKHPFAVVVRGLEEVLFRPTTEISDDLKLKIIGRLRELGTAEANKFFEDIQKRYTGSARVKQAIEQARLATSGGSR